MASVGALQERLASLAARRPPGAAPLWIESLPPLEALEEVRAQEGQLARLQEASFLLALGRAGEARTVLDDLPDLPAGLAPIRSGLLARAAAALCPVEREGLPGGLDETPSAGASPSLALSEWLERVRRWRRTVGV